MHPNTFVQEIQPILVTVLTVLWYQMEDYFTRGLNPQAGWVHQEYEELYDNCLQTSCDMLSGSFAGLLDESQVDALIDRMAQIVHQGFGSHQHQSQQKLRGNKAPQYEGGIERMDATVPFPTSFTCLLTVLIACLDRHEETTAGVLFPLLSTFETIQLLQLLLPVCIEHIRVRWDIDSFFEHLATPNQPRSDQEARHNLLSLATYLLKHLVFFLEGTASPDNVRPWLEQQFLSHRDPSGRPLSPQTLQQAINRFLGQCTTLAVDAVEYALDVLDGVTLALPQRDEQSDKTELVREAVRYVAAAASWLEPLRDGFRIFSVIDSSVETLFHATATFVATTAAHNVSVHTKPETRSLASIWLTQLARLALTDRMHSSWNGGGAVRGERATRAVNSASTSVAMQKSVVITLWVALDSARVIPEDLQFLVDCLHSRVTNGTGSATVGQKRKHRTDGTAFAQVPAMTKELQATTLACLLLPLGSGEALSKACVASLVRALPDTPTRSPWNTVLSRKVVETYGPTLRRRGHSTPDDRTLARFTQMHSIFATPQGTIGEDGDEKVDGNRSTTRTPSDDENQSMS